jgi:hypothetical protein
MGRMMPTLVVNPADDHVFVAFAHVLVDHGAASIGELEARLRTVYPRAAVHARELEAEATVIWYVYRDGHWVDVRPIADKTGAREHDVRSPRRPPIDRGFDPSGRRAREESGG